MTLFVMLVLQNCGLKLLFGFSLDFWPNFTELGFLVHEIGGFDFLDVIGCSWVELCLDLWLLLVFERVWT